MSTTLPAHTREPLSAAQRWRIWALALLVACINGLGWHVWAHRDVPPGVPERASSRLGGLAYAPFGRTDAPWMRDEPLVDLLKRDLAQIADYTERLRTYSAAQFDGLPRAAQEAGLSLSLGVWLNKDWGSNRRELDAALAAARAGQVEHLIVGNETVLRKDLTPAQLIDWLRIARAAADVPVTTAEPWHVWLTHPELGREVDFITIHLLPYWEGVAAENAVPHALQRLQWVREKHPGKRVVIGEVGYPSRGATLKEAKPSPLAQARFVREWVARAAELKLDYFLIEAHDQAWKSSEEGRAGAYWGLMDARRAPKFSFSGPLLTDPHWASRALGSSFFGLLAVLWFLHRFRNLGPRTSLCFALGTQAALSLAALVVSQPLTHYMDWRDWLMLGILVPTTLIMVLILLSHWLEFAELFGRGNLKRQFGPKPLSVGAVEPFVSIHVPTCNEQPDMVIATLRSLAALDHTQLEVIVVDNNTSDPALWQPVRDFMATLPAHFHFFHLPRWPGFKAGALNFALTQTDARAQIVGVVDADYIVKPNWLRDLVGHFDDAKVAVVQAPQAHRNWAASAWRTMMNWEYEGFFRIGMHHRNERDAIIQHGTMTLVRASALRAHGEWSAGTLCEDAELGLRLMQAGFRTVYVDSVMGEGLTPDGFAAFKRQRARWAQGGMHIFKMHARALLAPGAAQPGPRLSIGQRYHFLAGWLPWLGDALHLLFVLLALAWTAAGLAWPQHLGWPSGAYLMPLVVFVAAKLVMGPLLYARRVTRSVWSIAGASLAGMGLSHAIARGVWQGLIGDHGVFGVTPKGARAAGGWLGAVREEALLLAGLMVGASAVHLFGANRPDSALWVAMLLVQALPHAAALVCAALSARSEAPPSTELLRARPLGIHSKPRQGADLSIG